MFTVIALLLSSPASAGKLHLQLSEQFLPEAPAHHLSGRLVSENDSWLGAEARYSPLQEWMGRASVGVDLAGGDALDLQGGLFLGGAGTYTYEGAQMDTRPQGGAEIGVGMTAGPVFVKYRWLVGFGGGPLDSLLTENELTAGFKLGEPIRVFGQFLHLGPERTGVGLGVRVIL